MKIDYSSYDLNINDYLSQKWIQTVYAYEQHIKQVGSKKAVKRLKTDGQRGNAACMAVLIQLFHSNRIQTDVINDPSGFQGEIPGITRDLPDLGERIFTFILKDDLVILSQIGDQVVALVRMNLEINPVIMVLVHDTVIEEILKEAKDHDPDSERCFRIALNAFLCR